ncbi:pentatricopeptide repeat-containing protein [Pyrus ussuriensis x Pyrus communis]|uniref:Pentatricopeptide repeat-containing protein n=1 Tax=Pyrus ussuriensis x Pyrus communis TaxID=2448454 RepID=A0A5N5F248_9ROSA|nr:pentatricopeptide repeat-containing protein [Pyrus ussuriensis x Pyrus communis]
MSADLRHVHPSLNSQSFDYFTQFLPFANNSTSKSLCSVNSNERPKVTVGLSRIIKNQQGYALKGFSSRFCRLFLVKVMKLLGCRETAFGFFKLAFRDDSEGIVKSCCIAAHFLAGYNLHRSIDLVGFMWRGHCEYDSDFSFLDTLMRGFLNAEMGAEALEVVSRMREVGLKPSLSAIAILLRLLIRIGDYGSVWKVFRGMLWKGPHPCNYTFNMMILGFCRKGLITVGESLLHVMWKFQCDPDVITYNILINANCERGQADDALHWVHLMIARACKPSTVTFSTVINALCKEGNMKQRVSPDGITFNILIAGHYKYGREEVGDHLLKDISVSGLLPDSSLYDIMVSGLCWAGRLDSAIEFLEGTLGKGLPLTCSRVGLEQKAHKAYKFMITFGVTPLSSTCSSLLMGLSKKGNLQEAREFLCKVIEKAFPIKKAAFTVLLDGYFRIADLNGAQNLWNAMERRGICPDVVAFSAFINGLCKAGLVEEAYDIFLDTSRRGFVPNNFVYNSLIGGFCNCRKLSYALKLERDMRQKGLLPDIFTTNMIINGFCKQGRMKSAIDTFVDMYRTGLTPDIVTYNTLIGGYCKAFDMVGADEFLYKMCASGCEPDITTYNICVQGFCSSRKINRAVMMLDELVSRGVVPDSVTYNTMMNGAYVDMLDRAMILMAKLLKLAFLPNTVTINVLLSQFCKQGMPEKAFMWGQKLSEFSTCFDEITYILLDRAYHNLQEDSEISSGTAENSLFLDFVMYITGNKIEVATIRKKQKAAGLMVSRETDHSRGRDRRANENRQDKGDGRESGLRL